MRRWDAIVVGAGPAGSSAAYHMAIAGLQVLLLEKSSMPRDKSCGDGLTRSAVHVLRQMGLLDELTGWTIRGVRVHMGTERARDFPFPLKRHPNTEGLVVPRLVLDHAICRRAVRAGARLRERTAVRTLIIEDGAVVGVKAVDASGREQEHRAAVVVAADGAASRLARQGGLRDPSSAGLGVAVRDYYADIDGLDDRLEFYLSLMDASQRVLLPSYGWVFPTGCGTVNVGVGLFGRVPGETVGPLMMRFLQQFLARDRRFGRMRRVGPRLSAPLRFDFDPDRSARAGLMLVGDAAGLVSPFTGEGISNALESGQIAADTACRWLRYHPDEPIDGSDYRLRLSQQYAGYFEAGQQSGKRHRLIWNVLQTTFDSERPLHRLCRRVLLVPDGFHSPKRGELLEDLGPLLPRSGLEVRSSMMIVADLLTQTVRRDWPFLARLSSGRINPSSTPLRPSLLLLVCAHFGDPRAAKLPETGAAVELGYLAFLAHSGVEDGATGWGNTFSILVGEFLLAKAYELAGQVSVQTSVEFSQSVTSAIRGQLRSRQSARDTACSDRSVLDRLSLTAGTMASLPCRLGARVAGAPAEVVNALDRFGSCLGVAHALIDEVQMMEGTDDPLAEVAAFDPDDGVYGLPILHALHAGTTDSASLAALLAKPPVDRARVGELVHRSGVLDGIRTLAGEYADEAVSALDAVPRHAARVALRRIADYAVHRTLPEVGTSSELFDRLSEA